MLLQRDIAHKLLATSLTGQEQGGISVHPHHVADDGALVIKWLLAHGAVVGEDLLVHELVVSLEVVLDGVGFVALAACVSLMIKNGNMGV